RGDRLQPPLDRGDERQRPLRADQQIELIPGVGKTVQRVASGVLSRLRESGFYEPPLVGGQEEPLPAPRSPPDSPSFPIRPDALDRLDPASHATAPHRARPCCV